MSKYENTTYVEKQTIRVTKEIPPKLGGLAFLYHLGKGIRNFF